MDTLNENEANRELVSCLNMKGYKALYQHYLGNGRTADAFVCNTVVEGKLDPSQKETDRLIGQLVEYLKFGYSVVIVIYGRVSNDMCLNRIREIVSRMPDKLALVYLDNPQRVRSSSTVEEVVY